MRSAAFHRAVAASALLALLLWAPAVTVAQDAQAKAAAILANARKALGGEDKIRRIKTLQVKGEFQRTLGGNDISGDLEVLIELPDKLRRNEDLSFAGGPTITRTEVLNGNDIWDENSGGRDGFFIAGGRGGGRNGGFGGGGGGVRRGPGGAGAAGADAGAQGGAATQGGRRGFDPERLRELQLRMRRADLAQLMLAWLLQTDAPVTWVGTAEAPDGHADVLEVKPADGVPMRLFVDTSSSLPLMMTWEGFAARVFVAGRGRGRGDGQAAPDAGQPAAPPPPPGPPPQTTFQLHLSDYRPVNGIKLPYLMTRAANGQPNEEWKIGSYKINPAFKANTFTK